MVKKVNNVIVKNIRDTFTHVDGKRLESGETMEAPYDQATKNMVARKFLKLVNQK